MPGADPTFIALQSALAGEYSLERELGRGGMGIVYLAREVQLDRLVAIKALPLDLAGREDVRERFLREARTAAGLSHPNIVPIHRVGRAGDVPYFVMTYVRGETLGERLRIRGPLSTTMLTRVMHEVALALGHAHGRGIVHRDVKPDNILIEETSERALVSDFGIAHVASVDAIGGPVVGTKQFMSPEQARGEAIDGRSDVYSLGVVAYLAASGKLPVDHSIAPRVASAANGITTSLARTIDRCLEPNADHRFVTAEQVAESLVATPDSRAMLPTVLMNWAAQPAPLMGLYGAWTAGFLWAVLMQGTAVRHLDTTSLKYVALALLPTIPIALFQFRKTRHTLAAGYEIDDLRVALRAWVNHRRADLALAAARTEPTWAKALRVFPGLATVTLQIMYLTSQNWSDPRLSHQPSQAFIYSAEVLMVAALASLPIAASLGVSLLPPSAERSLVGRVRSVLWNSRFGSWLAKHLTPRVRGVPETNFRPTEMALEQAVDDLFAALPAAYRDLIGDLPAVAHGLSHHVAELRVEVERLETMKIHARGNETLAIDPLLDGARGQLGQSVTALERLRMELLRLQGGTNDLRPLTTSLDSARAMVEDLVRLREAEDEIELRVQPRLAIDARSPSPA